MTASRTRLRLAAAPLLVGLVALLGAACAPPPAAPTGNSFNPPGVGYVGKQYVPTATAANNLPVSFSLDAASSGCSLTAGVLHFTSVGSCIVLADQPGDATHPALPQVRRTITVYGCPPLRGGVWTGPQGTSATVVLGGSTSFSGTVDLSAFGAGVQSFAGTIDCDLVRMTFNGTALSGRLSPDGATLSASYSGFSVVLYAPAA
jgi:streptogramin lyase